MNVSTQNSEISQQDVRSALAGVVYEGLRPVVVSLSFLYLIFAVAHCVILPRSIAVPMVITAFLSAVLFVSLSIVVHQGLITARCAHQTAAGIAQIMLLNSFLHLYLTAEMYQTTNIILTIVGVACVFLSPFYFVFVLTTAFIGWGMIIRSLPTSPERVHFAFAMFTATVLGLVVFYVRLRIHQRLERLRLQDIR
jgi:hypothetical protein